MKRYRNTPSREDATPTVATLALVTRMLFSGLRCSARCTPCGMLAETTGGIAKSNRPLVMRHTVGVEEGAEVVEAGEALGEVLVGAGIAIAWVGSLPVETATPERMSIGTGTATLGNAVVKPSITAMA